MTALANLGTRLDTLSARLAHALRSLAWALAAAVSVAFAAAFAFSALLVSAWDAGHLPVLLAPALVFALLAVLFAFLARRAHRSTSRVPTEAWAAAASLIALWFLGPSRELVALGVRVRAVLALIAHLLHLWRDAHRSATAAGRAP